MGPFNKLIPANSFSCDGPWVAHHRLSMYGAGRHCAGESIYMLSGWSGLTLCPGRSHLCTGGRPVCAGAVGSGPVRGGTTHRFGPRQTGQTGPAWGQPAGRRDRGDAGLVRQDGTADRYTGSPVYRFLFLRPLLLPVRYRGEGISAW